MGDLESTLEQQKIFSRLIDYLNTNNEKIKWELLYPNRYISRAARDQICMYYDFCKNSSSLFQMNFNNYMPILDLKPRPDLVLLFSDNPRAKDEGEENRGHLPIFKVRYDTTFTLEFEAAKNAMLDFIENGEKLAEYFVNMRREPKEQYFKLIQKFESFKDEDIIRLG